jgi:peptidoglycan/LPS O-acetylase OafA/YrhL
MRHSANLDILRSFAVTAVLTEHFIDALGTNLGYDNTSVTAVTNNLGAAGVAAFFVHTCLVLMYSLERLNESGNKVSLRFYVRRIFRIYPLAIFCIAMAVILHIPNWPREDAYAITPRIIVANLFLVQNLIGKVSVIGPLWSLAYEVQMYVVLPALFYLALMKRAILYICCLIAVFCGLGLALAFTTGHMNMAAYIPDFLCGILCYTLRDHFRAFIPSILWSPFVVVLIGAFCFVNLGTGPSFWTGWIFCLVLGLAINLFHDSENKPVNAIAGRVAMYSYGMYLLHVPVLYLVFMVLDIRSIAVAAALFVAITIASSAITYHLLEARFIAIGKRLSSEPSHAPKLEPAK